jgi:hypothetical protein
LPGCIDQEMRAIKRSQPGQVSCVVNPRMQRESVCIDVEGDRKDRPEKYSSSGGGLAGLEAARRTAFAGHHVVLCDRRGWLGGQIRLAAKIPAGARSRTCCPGTNGSLPGTGRVRLSTNVDAALIDSVRPEVVFVATGSVRRCRRA